VAEEHYWLWGNWIKHQGHMGQLCKNSFRSTCFCKKSIQGTMCYKHLLYNL